ncbi:15982_t:CDS:2 [Acaulospora morrowiae]|uniref:15982_t:CDS:1 n=1 Tax=Acaulospora morrowiae TaxID=94023 RepID=A0A9N9FTY0_9GLOM|nr:15982_t:CDS:2 [Acaulospora morrowiae]
MASRNNTAGTFSEEGELFDSPTRIESGPSRKTRPCRNQKKRQESVDLINEPYGLPSSSGSHNSLSVFQDPARIATERSPRPENTTSRARRPSKRALDTAELGSLTHTNSSSASSRSNKRRMLVKNEEVPTNANGNNSQRIILPPPQRNSPIRNSPLGSSPARISSACNSPVRNSQYASSQSSDQASMDGHITGGVTLPPISLPEHSTHGRITLPPLRSVLPIDVEHYAESILNFQEEVDEVVDLTSSPPYPSPPPVIDLTSSPVIVPYTPYPSFPPYRFALESQVNPEVILIDDDSSDVSPPQVQRVMQDGNMTPPYSQDRSTTPPHPSQTQNETSVPSLAGNGTSIPRGLQLKCAICLDRPKDVSSTICGHIFCFECISTAVRTQKTCSLCRKSITKKQIKRLEFKHL